MRRGARVSFEHMSEQEKDRIAAMVLELVRRCLAEDLPEPAPIERIGVNPTYQELEKLTA